MGKKMTVRQAVTEFFNGTVSEGLIYQACREKKLPHVKIGSRIILDEDSLKKWWEEQLKESVRSKSNKDYGRLRRIEE